MLIPERTIDLWCAATLQRYLPGSLVWGPTPWEQHHHAPWDVELRTSTGKLMVLENKGVQDDGSIHINKVQLSTLCRLQARARAVGAPDLFLYALPGYPRQPVRRWATMQREFPHRTLMFRPETLQTTLRRLSRKGSPHSKFHSVTAGRSDFRVRLSDPLSLPVTAKRLSLVDVLGELSLCRRGVPIGPGWLDLGVDPIEPGRWLEELGEMLHQDRAENETPPELVWLPI